MAEQPSEMVRVLAALDEQAEISGGLTADAARLLRALARDFDEYGHMHTVKCATDRDSRADCTCGLDAARARWRITP